LKALSLFALAIGLHHLRVGNSDEIITGWCKAVRVDPDNKIAHTVIAKITGLSPGRLHELGIGTFFYGLLFATEGTGLLLKQRWAEYLTVISTTLFLPLEIYEVVATPNRKLLKAAVLLANIAILVYLVGMLIKVKRREKMLESLDPRIDMRN
jgi:uncharacterized membrane protein (DUF2068 family)